MAGADERHYNYDTFVREHFRPQARFDVSPVLGRPAPDFPLWRLDDRSETSLKQAWQGSSYVVVEFGSYT